MAMAMSSAMHVVSSEFESTFENYYADINILQAFTTDFMEFIAQ